MDVDFQTAMKKASIGTLESMAFLMLDSGEHYDKELLTHGVKVTFQGEYCGELQVWSHGKVLKFLAENILAQGDESQLQEQGFEALKEVTNITTGHFLTEKYGFNKVFDLGIPQALEFFEPLQPQIILESLETGMPIVVQLRMGFE